MGGIMESNRFLSRKFLLAIFIIAGNFLMIYYGKISDGVYSTVVVATIGAYLTSNVIAKKDNNTAAIETLKVTQ